MNGGLGTRLTVMFIRCETLHDVIYIYLVGWSIKTSQYSGSLPPLSSGAVVKVNQSNVSLPVSLT